jgi:hypothetical protein
MFEATALDVGIVLLLTVAFAEYFKWRAKLKGFSWLALSGVLMVFAGTFGVAGEVLGAYVEGIWTPLQGIFIALGWLFALVGTLFIIYETLSR